MVLRNLSKPPTYSISIKSVSLNLTPTYQINQIIEHSSDKINHNRIRIGKMIHPKTYLLNNIIIKWHNILVKGKPYI